MSIPKQFIRNVQFLSNTDSTNLSTSSVILSGGLSVAKNVNLGSNLTIFSNLTVGNILMNGFLYTSAGSQLSGSQWIGSGSSSIFYYNTTANTYVGIGTTVPAYSLDVIGNIRITGGSLLATGNCNTIGSIFTTNGNIGIGTTSPLQTLDVNGNINFSGALYKSNVLYISSQWSGTTGTLLYYGSTGNINVGIGTTNPTYTLDIAGSTRISSTQDSINSTTGGLIVNSISISSLTDSSSITQGGAFTVNGGVSIGKTLNVGTALNLGAPSIISTEFVGSSSAGNNVVSATNVNGLIFPTLTFRSFNTGMQISTLVSSGSNIFTLYTIEGIQNDSGWLIDETFIGDTPSLSFSMLASGQIQYTSTNVLNWVSTTIKFNSKGYFK
jgi:hypothetical protein